MTSYNLQFMPLIVDEHIDFCIAAHRETYRLTYGREIDDSFLASQLENMRLNWRGVVPTFSPDGYTILTV